MQKLPAQEAGSKFEYLFPVNWLEQYPTFKRSILVLYSKTYMRSCRKGLRVERLNVLAAFGQNGPLDKAEKICYGNQAKIDECHYFLVNIRRKRGRLELVGE
jgi:hypothetical protein